MRHNFESKSKLKIILAPSHLGSGRSAAVERTHRNRGSWVRIQPGACFFSLLYSLSNASIIQGPSRRCNTTAMQLEAKQA